MSRIEEATAALKEGRDTAERYVHEVDHVFAFGMLCNAVQRAVRILEQTDQPAIPEGFVPYDGSGQPVADDVVVEWQCHDSNYNKVMAHQIARELEWDWRGEDSDIIAYRIIHDPSRLPDVPWGDYPEAARATLDGDGILTLWRDGFDLSLRQRVLARFPGFDMTHLDPARCKWERPPQRSPRKSIDDARPEEWNRVAAASNDAHVLRMDLQALQRRVASIERSLMHIDRSR